MTLRLTDAQREAIDAAVNQPITNAHYRALRKEAIAAGDDDLADACTLAIAGDHAAQRQCDRVIIDARELAAASE